MGEAYLVDTNVFSDYLENKFTVEGSAFFENIIISKAKISFINKIELQGHNLPNLSKYKAISDYT